ncbi:hypothetical protein EMPG_10236 [Blastomyces silverae]|uniref:Uncharacterized protein n=1 Tax=Blastomyces silverae TaxID=2060906 RepID=A0A0H1B5V7_9EURO|nr:hypothetical protein EMPG_10236 [Blastomyces silverae]
MLARLMNMITPFSAPSALLVVGKFGATIRVLHLLPEDGTIERFDLTTPSSITTFRHRGATEKARKQIGVVTLHVGDGETTTSFLDDVETQACRLWKDSKSSSLTLSAALDAIHKRVGRDRSMNATQTFPVFVVHITRSRPGRLLTTEPTSLA